MTAKNPFQLDIGIHRGTITSRDSEQPKQFATREEAITSFNEAHSFYRSIGYQIWYAYLTDFTDTTQPPIRTTLETNPYQ